MTSSSEETQLKRLMARDDSTREAALARVNSQMPISTKARHADIVIDNDNARDALDGQVRNLVERLLRKTRWTWMLEWLCPPAGVLAAAVTLCFKSMRRR